MDDLELECRNPNLANLEHKFLKKLNEWPKCSAHGTAFAFYQDKNLLPEPKNTCILGTGDIR